MRRQTARRLALAAALGYLARCEAQRRLRRRAGRKARGLLSVLRDALVAAGAAGIRWRHPHLPVVRPDRPDVCECGQPAGALVHRLAAAELKRRRRS